MAPTQSPIRLTHCAFSKGVVKRPRRELYSSPPSNIEIGNERRCTAIPSICLCGMRRENVSSIIMNRESSLWGYLTLRLLMSYIYGAPILDVSRSHTTTQHSR